MTTSTASHPVPVVTPVPTANGSTAYRVHCPCGEDWTSSLEGVAVQHAYDHWAYMTAKEAKGAR